MRLSSLRAAAALIFPVIGVAMTGCTSAGGGANGVMARDILEMKHMMEDQKRSDESQQRQLEYRLKNVETAGETQTNMLKSSLTEMEESMRRQQQAIDQMQRDLKGVNAQMEGRSPVAAPAPTSTPMAEATTPGAAVPTPAPEAAAAQPSVDDLIEQGLQNYNSGNYAGARETFEKAVAANPGKDQSIKSRYWLSQSAMQLNDMTAAQESYFKVIELDNTHPLAWQSLEGLAQIFQRQGKADTALQYYNVILKDNPTYPNIDRVKEQMKALGGAKK